MKCIRVGLVGFGFAGRIFQSNVIEAVEGLELAAIVQRSGSERGRRFPSCQDRAFGRCSAGGHQHPAGGGGYAERHPPADRPAVPAGRPSMWSSISPLP